MIREKEEEEEEGSRRSKRSRRSRWSGRKTESAARLTGTEKGVDMGNRMTRILNGGRGYEGEDMMLYWVSGSPACFRVMLALEEKKLTRYKQKHLSFSDNEHKTDDILRLNPRGQVPTFHHRNKVINESMAICEYLQYCFPARETRFTPRDSNGFRLMTQKKYEAQNLQKKCEDVIYYLRDTPSNKLDPEDVTKRKKAFHEELQLWEDYLKQFGDGVDNLLSGRPQLTLADLAFFPYLAFCVQFGLDLDHRFPALSTYYARVSRRDAVQRAWPSYWDSKNIPEEQRFFADI